MSPFEIFVRIFFLHFSWQPDESFQTNRKENSIHLRCKLVPEWKQRSALLCKLYFHPAKFDNFKDEKIQSTYVVSLHPNENREVLCCVNSIFILQILTTSKMRKFQTIKLSDFSYIRKTLYSVSPRPLPATYCCQRKRKLTIISFFYGWHQKKL